MIESGIERIVKIQVRTALRQLIKELRTISLLASPAIKHHQATTIAKMLRDTKLIADSADKLWPDSADGGKIRKRGRRSEAEINAANAEGEEDAN